MEYMKQRQLTWRSRTALDGEREFGMQDKNKEEKEEDLD